MGSLEDVIRRVKSPSWYDEGRRFGLMNHLESFLSWSILLFEIVLCGFVFARKVQRILPVFAIYTCGILAGTIGVWLTYKYSGFYSLTSYYAFWSATLLNAVLRSLAIAELCRFGLRVYRGIWALVWRVLAALSILLIARTGSDAWGQPNRVALYGTTVDRDLAIASIVILAVLLIFRNYYGITLEPLQRMISVGICFICVVDVIGNTILRNIFTGYLLSFFLSNQQAIWSALTPQFERVRDTWNVFHLISFMFSMGIWCFALRKPLAVPGEPPVLLPSSVYRELSPAINLRLASFNNRMVELLKP
jgi:hypothetical protein